MLMTVNSLLPSVSRSLMAAVSVHSSPGSSTLVTPAPLRTRRLVAGSRALTTVLGSGICLTQTYIFIGIFASSFSKCLKQAKKLVQQYSWCIYSICQAKIVSMFLANRSRLFHFRVVQEGAGPPAFSEPRQGFYFRDAKRAGRK